jgi:hypothetical protein
MSNGIDPLSLIHQDKLTHAIVPVRSSVKH